MSTIFPLALNSRGLTNGTRAPFVPPSGTGKLPEPPFPRKPDLLARERIPEDGGRHWTPQQIYGAMRGWAFPYFKSRLLPGDFHPIVAYLFTEYKCNLDCHYCYSFDNRVKGMTEDVARASIDWLHSTTCRVLALMGGESAMAQLRVLTEAPAFVDADWLERCPALDSLRSQPDFAAIVARVRMRADAIWRMAAST